MKSILVVGSLFLVGCTHTAKPIEKIEKTCSGKCHKPYGIGNKYQNKQKELRCQKKCQNQKDTNYSG